MGGVPRPRASVYGERPALALIGVSAAMPLTLVLRSSESSADESEPSLTFDGTRVVIGRGASCDVRLPDPSVSHRHASVRAAGSDYSLVDEKSTNGTFVAGVRLAPQTPRPLKHGDRIRVGRVWLEARIDQTPATRDLAFATRDLALALVSQALRGLGEAASTRVYVVEGRDAGAELVLAEEARAYLIGRDVPCDLQLADVDVSRVHVHVARRRGTVLVRDAGSKNGARLGDAWLPTDRETPWRAGALLRLGGTTLALDDPAAAALAELEAAEDEPIGSLAPPPEPIPIAGLPDPTTVVAASSGPTSPVAGTPRRRTGASFTATDVAVVVAALSVIALSIAGLVWLLRT